jgi:hypothetical protein
LLAYVSAGRFPQVMGFGYQLARRPA